MIQAQIKIHEDSTTELVNTKKAFDELTKKISECEAKVSEASKVNNSLIADNSNKQNQVNNLNALQNEKDRLQGAVNDYMKQMKQLNDDKSKLENILNSLKSDLDNKNKYITQLEEIAPVTKLKKIKAPDVQINSGGTF
jgi:predicted  nucleic acid-binding Zn-ribbon protein